MKLYWALVVCVIALWSQCHCFHIMKTFTILHRHNRGVMKGMKVSQDPTPLYFMPNAPVELPEIVEYLRGWAKSKSDQSTQIRPVDDGVKIYFSGTNGSYIHFFAGHKSIFDPRLESDSNNDITISSRLVLVDDTKPRVNSLIKLMASSLMEGLSIEIADAMLSRGLEDSLKSDENNNDTHEDYEEVSQYEKEDIAPPGDKWLQEKEGFKRAEIDLVNSIHEEDIISEDNECEDRPMEGEVMTEPLLSPLNSMDSNNIQQNCYHKITKQVLLASMDISPMVLQQQVVVDTIHQWCDRFLSSTGSGISYIKEERGVVISFIIDDHLKVSIFPNSTDESVSSILNDATGGIRENLSVLLSVDVLLTDQDNDRNIDLAKDIDDINIEPKLKMIKFATGNICKGLEKALSKLLEDSFHQATKIPSAAAQITTNDTHEEELRRGMDNNVRDIDFLANASKINAIQESMTEIEKSVQQFKAKTKTSTLLKQDNENDEPRLLKDSNEERNFAAKELQDMINNNKKLGFASIFATNDDAKELLLEVASSSSLVAHTNSSHPEDGEVLKHRERLASLFLKGKQISEQTMENLLDKPLEIESLYNNNNIPASFNPMNSSTPYEEDYVALQKSIDDELQYDGASHDDQLQRLLQVNKDTIKLDSYRLQLLVTDLERALGTTELENLVLDAFLDLYLSDNFLPMLKSVNATETNPQRRLLYQKINQKALQTNLNLFDLMQKESARHLATIEKLCMITSLMTSQDQNDHIRYYEEMENMKNYIDTELLSYLNFAIEQEEKNLKKQQYKEDPQVDPSAWLQILRIIRKGVLAEFEARYLTIFEGLFYTLRFHDYPDLQEHVFQYYINETAIFDLGYMKVLATNMIEHFLLNPDSETKEFIEASRKQLPPSSSEDIRGQLIEGDMIEKMHRLRHLVEKFLPDEELESKMESFKAELDKDDKEIVFVHRDPQRQIEIEVNDALKKNALLRGVSTM